MLKKIFIIILGIVLSSCIQRIYQVDNASLSDGKYDSEFPSQNCSKQIKEISESVKMLNCMVIYRTYFFSRNDSIRENEIEKAIKANKMINETFDHEPVSGTATIISTENNKIVLLTCAHIIDFPDRLVTKFTEEDRSFRSLFLPIESE